MNIQNQINNIITYSLFIGLSLGLIFVYFAQERLYREMTVGDISLGPERFLRNVSVVFIFIAVVLTVFKSKNEYSTKIFLSYIGLFGYILVNFLLTGPGIGDVTPLMDTRGIGPWVCFGLIFIGYSDKRYAIFKKFLIVSIVFISLLVIYNLIDFGAGEYRGMALSKYRVYAVNLVWMTPYIFLILKNNEKLIALRIFAISIGIITALITQTRSFLLIYILVFLFDFFYTKRKVYYTVGIVILSMFFIYMVLNTQSLGSSVDLLLKRGAENTRSGQLAQFINQLNFFELIVGNGYEASWIFNGTNYRYLDNQWLLLIWWAGFIPTALYFYLTAIIPTKLFFTKNIDYETKVESFILIIWTLACTGLAIYTTMAIEFFFFIICIIQGRLLYKYSKMINHEYR